MFEFGAFTRLNLKHYNKINNYEKIMELLKFLKKAIQERYVANATVTALEEEVKHIIKDKIKEKL